MDNSDTNHPPRSTDTRNYNEPSNCGLEKCDCSIDNNCGCTFPNNTCDYTCSASQAQHLSTADSAVSKKDSDPKPQSPTNVVEFRTVTKPQNNPPH